MVTKTIHKDEEFDLSWVAVPSDGTLDAPPTVRVLETPPLTEVKNVATDGMSCVVASSNASGVSTIEVTGVSRGIPVVSTFEVVIEGIGTIPVVSFEFTAGEARPRV